MTPKQEYSLSDLMSEVNLVIRSSFDKSYWVVAEIANVSTSPVGHMYFELVEKSGAQIIAKARANLWSSKKRQIISAFEDLTQESIKRGMSVLLQLTVEFHAVYGISFQIHDIDPAYSLGELQRQKQETIKRLKSEGLLDFNKQYVLNPVIQNIAVISSETAAGYQDFMNQLGNNEFHYQFNTTIYPAVMQGESASTSIIKAIESIDNSNIFYDALVIIRGGGSNLDLACFDDYELNARLSQSIYPVFSGIGHERDLSVTDMVAHTRLKTPTAVADFIIFNNLKFEEKIKTLFNRVSDLSKDAIAEGMYSIENHSRSVAERSKRKVNRERNNLRNCSFRINKSSLELISRNRLFLRHQKSELTHSASNIKTTNNYIITNTLNKLTESIKEQNRKKQKETEAINTKLHTVSYLIQQQKNQLNFLHNSIKLSDPGLILKRGFSISRINGKAIKDASMLKENDILETQLYRGSVKSKIINKK